MFEALFLIAVVLLLPFVPSKGLLLLLIFCVITPGLYAMYTGAPYFPSISKRKEAMLKLANIQKGDTVYDLGCGDGRLVRAAAKKGARAIGYELSVPTFVIAWVTTLFHRNATIRLKNFWKGSYKDADVVLCFLMPDSMQEFYKKIWPQLKPGCRVVSHAFSIKNLEPKAKDGPVMLYVK
jgi:2-polyprenyl-3-methyl-5-hydroxy-6-metoxy-1,4-benzoquinol methylase